MIEIIGDDINLDYNTENVETQQDDYSVMTLNEDEGIEPIVDSDAPWSISLRGTNAIVNGTKATVTITNNLAICKSITLTNNKEGAYSTGIIRVKYKSSNSLPLSDKEYVKPKVMAKFDKLMPMLNIDYSGLYTGNPTSNVEYWPRLVFLQGDLTKIAATNLLVRSNNLATIVNGEFNNGYNGTVSLTFGATGVYVIDVQHYYKGAFSSALSSLITITVNDEGDVDITRDPGLKFETVDSAIATVVN